MTPTIGGKPKSRKVIGYVKAVLALEVVQKKRTERYERYVRPLDVKGDALAVATAGRPQGPVRT